MSRSLAFFFLKVFKRRRKFFFKKHRKFFFKKLYSFSKPQGLIRRGRFNFFQFFFLRKRSTPIDSFFRFFEKSDPSSVLSFFVDTTFFKSLFFFKLFYPLNLVRFEPSLPGLFKRKVLGYSGIYSGVSSPFLLFFYLRRFGFKGVRSVFFNLKKHFFFKNVSKKFSFLDINKHLVYPIFFKNNFFLFDHRTCSFFFKNLRSSSLSSQHPLN